MEIFDELDVDDIYLDVVDVRGRQEIEKTEGKWEPIGDPLTAYKILGDALSIYNPKEGCLIRDEYYRWFDIEINKAGEKFATSGTNDLEYYYKII